MPTPPSSVSILLLAKRHGLPDETASRLVEVFETPLTRCYPMIHQTIEAFSKRHPWSPTEPSLWFQTSDRALEAADAFFDDWLRDPLVLGQLHDPLSYNLRGSLLSEFLEHAVRRKMVKTTRHIGQLVEAMPQTERTHYVGVFMDFFYRLGNEQSRTGRETQPDPHTSIWWMIWNSLGPQCQALASTPPYWSGFFESPAGKRSGSELIEEHLHPLLQLSFAVQHCSAAAPFLIDRLSTPAVHEALATHLVSLFAQAHANQWPHQATDLLGLLDRFQSTLHWSEAQWSVLEEAARTRKNSSSQRKWTPPLDAWLENKRLSHTLGEPSAPQDAADSAMPPSVSKRSIRL